MKEHEVNVNKQRTIYENRCKRLFIIIVYLFLSFGIYVSCEFNCSFWIQKTWHTFIDANYC